MKVVDEVIGLTRSRSGAILREEVWEDEDGNVVKYNLAHINPFVCPVDNGRVLGYDNNHGSHHRHFMGSVSPVEFTTYRECARHFYDEAAVLWREHEAQD